MITRKDAVQTSRDAGDSVDTSKMEEIVFNAIVKFPQNTGCTPVELALITGIPHYRISPRLKGLERKELIYYQGDTRKGTTNRQLRVIRINRRKTQRLV